MTFRLLLVLFLGFALPVFSETTDTGTAATAETDSTDLQKPDVLTQDGVGKVKSDDEIPVNLAKLKKADVTDASSSRFYMTFGLMALLLGGGYYLAKKYGRPKASPQTKIKILTQHYLGPKKSLAIVRVAGESVLVGITDHNITMIKSLALLDDEIPEETSQASFQDTLMEKKEMTMKGPASAGLSGSRSAAKDQGEEFSIRHIKDAVTLKLKSMRADN